MGGSGKYSAASPAIWGTWAGAPLTILAYSPKLPKYDCDHGRAPSNQNLMAAKAVQLCFFFAFLYSAQL